MNDDINQSKQALVFVYNSDSGLFNTLTDIGHKIFSPETYQCNLCALTYSTFRIRQKWKQFLETLEQRTEFIHADELKVHYGISDVPLPAIFQKEAEGLTLWIEKYEINACSTVDDLKRLIRNKCFDDANRKALL